MVRHQFFQRYTLFQQKNDLQYLPPQSPVIKRILLVDDDPDLTLTFKAGLEGYRYGERQEEEI